jgi:hypothetical protein
MARTDDSMRCHGNFSERSALLVLGLAFFRQQRSLEPARGNWTTAGELTCGEHAQDLGKSTLNVGSVTGVHVCLNPLPVGDV